MEIITLDKVTKCYDNEYALKEFSLTVNKGECLTVIGRSGCGKTTMLKLMNGLLLPDSGSVRIEGVDIHTADLIALRRRIGYVIQNKGLFPHMTVEKNITYVPVISGKKNKEENHRLALQLLKQVGLKEDMASRYPSELSGGQQQRVGIARALAARPSIMLMDEPFGALDEITRQSMQDELLRLKADLHLTIVFVTHDIREAMKLGDRVLVMDAGKTVQLAAPAEIKAAPENDFVRGLLQAIG